MVRPASPWDRGPTAIQDIQPADPGLAPPGDQFSCACLAEWFDFYCSWTCLICNLVHKFIGAEFTSSDFAFWRKFVGKLAEFVEVDSSTILGDFVAYPTSQLLPTELCANLTIWQIGM